MNPLAKLKEKLMIKPNVVLFQYKNNRGDICNYYAEPIPPRPKTKPPVSGLDASRLCNREIKSSIDYYYLVNCLIDKKFPQDTAKLPKAPSTQSVEVVNMVNELGQIEELKKKLEINL